MNFRYTIYNRVTGLHTENECEAVNEKMFVITLLETMGPEDWQNTKVMYKDSTGEMVPLMKWVMKYDCFNLARVKLFETFATGHIRILSREDYNLLVNLQNGAYQRNRTYLTNINIVTLKKVSYYFVIPKKITTFVYRNNKRSIHH